MSAKGRISKEILCELSQDVISHEWQFFIRCLFSTDKQLDESTIQAAIINKPGQVREQIYQLLLLWWEKPDATLDNIIRALDEHKRPDLVDKYQGFKKSTTELEEDVREQQSSAQRQEEYSQLLKENESLKSFHENLTMQLEQIRKKQSQNTTRHGAA